MSSGWEAMLEAVIRSGLCDRWYLADSRGQLAGWRIGGPMPRDVRCPGVSTTSANIGAGVPP